MNRNFSALSLSAACMAAITLSGCAYDYQAEQSFGQSVSLAIRDQAIRPNGIGVDGVSPGFDGNASKAVMDRYQRSYEFPQTMGNVLNLGIGTGTAAGAGAGLGVGTTPATGMTGR